MYLDILGKLADVLLVAWAGPPSFRCDMHFRCMSLGEVLRGEGRISPATPRNRNNDQPSTGQLLSEVWSLSATRSCLEDITAGHTHHHDVSFCPIATNYAKKIH